MAEEYVEDEALGEEAPLSAEELFEQHKAEIDAAFEEKGFFKRFGEMCKGLSQPKSSPEYKLAKTELQRLSAPILALLLPTMGVIILIVVTAVTGQQKESIVVDIAKAQEEEQQLEEETEEEDVEPETPPEETPDIQVDTPVVGPVSDMVAPTATPTTQPVSVKPAAQESVALIKSPVTMKSMAGSRNPGTIGAMTRGGAGYGDAQTEAAVMKALRWLKKTQQPSGAWGGTIANTALAVLAYLAHGETPGSKEFGETVMKAIQYLIDNQTDGPNGPTFRGVDGNEYATLICTYALCEAYGMTKNPNAKEAALKALQRIVSNQSPTGGWDYKINKASTRDDMSFEGWALQAIKAGKMAGLHPDGLDECIKKAIKCLKTRNFRSGGFNYCAGGGPTGLTATGCLCMQLLGYMNEPEVKAALDTMRAWMPGFEGAGAQGLAAGLPGGGPQYYCYYAAQCKYQAGMCENADPKNVKTWQEWNQAMKALYTSTIVTLDETIEGPDGKPKAIGYWPKGYNNATMGTCLCALQLMVYYRYLPTTSIKAGKANAPAGGDDGAKKGDKKRSKAAPKQDAAEVEVNI